MCLSCWSRSVQVVENNSLCGFGCFSERNGKTKQQGITLKRREVIVEYFAVTNMLNYIKIS